MTVMERRKKLYTHAVRIVSTGGRKWVSPNLETAVSMSMRDHNQNDHTSNGSEAFSLLLKMPWRKQICIAIYLCLIETICPKIRAKSLPKNTKSQFPVDVRCSKTSLLKLPTMRSTTFSPVPAKIATVPEVFFSHNRKIARREEFA